MPREKVCPRCGAPYSYIERLRIGGNTYLYAVHYVGKGKSRRKERCYLGPERYINAERLLKLNLRGVTSIDYEEVAEAAIQIIMSDISQVAESRDAERIASKLSRIEELAREARLKAEETAEKLRKLEQSLSSAEANKMRHGES